MMDEQNRHAGKPGQPGGRGTAQHGGTGGEGGAGGEGQVEGGTGGAGGAGGQVGQLGKRLTMWVYAALVVVAALSIGVVGWQVREQNQQIDEVANEAHRAICELRADLERRVAATEEFLAEHPEGIPGIPRSTFERTLQGQRSTIEALAFVECR